VVTQIKSKKDRTSAHETAKKRYREPHLTSCTNGFGELGR